MYIFKKQKCRKFVKCPEKDTLIKNRSLAGFPHPPPYLPYKLMPVRIKVYFNVFPSISSTNIFFPSTLNTLLYGFPYFVVNPEIKINKYI